MAKDIELSVSDLEDSRAFYGSFLFALDDVQEEKIRDPQTRRVCAYRYTRKGKDAFLIKTVPAGSVRRSTIVEKAKDVKRVDAFYNAGIAAGGRHLKGPEYREEYVGEEEVLVRYYNASVADADGNGHESKLILA